MSIQPQFESHRYVGEVCRVKGQSVVECRLPGSEISSILAIYAKAIPEESTCGDGEVRYGGKVLLCIAYEDGEKKICRSERGAEFFHKAEGRLITPSCFAKVGYTTENVVWRREGSGLYVSVIVGADIDVYGGKQVEYLSGGEGMICQKSAQTICKTVCVSGEIEGEDEFDCDYVGDILLHSQSAIVTHAAANAGQIELEGELSVHIGALKGEDGVCSYERLLPFRMQIPCDEAFGSVKTAARVCVKSARLDATTDEEGGKSKMLLSYNLAADCFLHIQEEISAVEDAFSPNEEVRLNRVYDWGRYLTNTLRCTERVSGVASLSPEMEGEYALQAAVLPRAEISCRKGENGMEAEGVILAEALFKGADGGRRTATVSLPFLFPLDCEGEEAVADSLVCGLTLRRKKSGEVEAEATLKLAVRCYEQCGWSYVSGVEAGEPYPPEESAFSVFLTGEGETAWSVAKRLRCTPERLQADNPTLEFPTKKGEKLFIYRQI